MVCPYCMLIRKPQCAAGKGTRYYVNKHTRVDIRSEDSMTCRWCLIRIFYSRPTNIYIAVIKIRYVQHQVKYFVHSFLGKRETFVNRRDIF